MTSNKFLWCADVLVFYSVLACAWALLHLVSASYMYYAHVDPAVVVVTQQWMHGLPMYPTPGSGAHYGLIYGPLNFLFTAAGLALFDDPIMGGKFSAVFLCILALLVFIWTARRSMPWREALIASGLMSIQSLILHSFCFGVAVTPTLELAAVLGILSLTYPNGNVRVGILVLATVLAIGSKVHGPLYVLPAWVVLWSEGGSRRALICAALSAVFFLALFLIPGISLVNYVGWLRFASRHPLGWEEFILTVGWELAFALPVLLYFLAPGRWRIWTSTPELDRVGLSLLAAMVLVLAPASKEGAGYHHAWPFIPWIAWFTLKWVHGMREVAIAPRYLLMTRIAVVIWVGGLAEHDYDSMNAIGAYFSASPVLSHIEADVERVMQHYPDAPVQMGYGAADGYYYTYVRPWVYQRATPCLVDAPSEMDIVAGGGSTEPILKDILARRHDIWLIPRDDPPFSMRTWYPPWQPLFGKDFGPAFLRNFTKVGRSRYFDIYQAKASVGSDVP